ncbi:MAG: molybdate ABC transporter permease subunit [Candidatus Velthaea sp.]
MTFARWPLAVPAALLLLALGAPVAALLFAVTPADAVAALRAPDVGAAAATSLRASALAVAVALVLGVPAGYLIARGRAAARGFFVLVFALPLVFPPVAAGVMLLALVGNRQPVGAWLAAHGAPIVDRLAGVTLAEFFSCAPLVVIAAAAAFGEVDVRLEEAARTLGAGTLGVFARIAVPLAAPGIAAGALLAWLRALGEYGATSVVAYHPASLPIALYVALSADGLQRALAIAYVFAALAACVVVTQALVRRRVL